MSTRVLINERLFADGEHPVLLGSTCAHCGATSFPRVDTCPYCATEDPAPVELSGRGTLWAWTAVTAAPPGYRGEIPYGVGVVEFPEGVRVIGRLTESDPGALSSGQEMDLVVVPLHLDEESNEVVTYAFSPVGAP